MKIGIPALTFQLDKAIDICKSNDYINHIEIGIDNIDECDIVKKYLTEINDNNISIGIHLPMELNTCENVKYISNSWIKFVTQIYNELNQFKIEYFNMHLGYVITKRYEKQSQKYLHNSIDFISKLDLELGCNIFIENTYSRKGDISNIGTKSSEFEYIFNNVNNSNIKLCYDTGHNLINSDEYLDILKDKIDLVHLSDNDGENDSHIGIGKGKIELSDLDKILKINPSTLILEVEYSELDYSLNILKQFI